MLWEEFRLRVFSETLIKMAVADFVRCVYCACGQWYLYCAPQWENRFALQSTRELCWWKMYKNTVLSAGRSQSHYYKIHHVHWQVPSCAVVVQLGKTFLHSFVMPW